MLKQVGKSALITRYLEKRFEIDYLKTIGVDYGSSSTVDVEVKGGKIVLIADFFDLSGDKDFVSIRNEFYSDAHGILFVYEVSNLKSFELLDHFRDEALRFGLNLNIPMILCANKVDLELTFVSEEQGREYATKHNMIFFESSAYDGTNVDSMFKCLLENSVSIEK